MILIKSKYQSSKSKRKNICHSSQGEGGFSLVEMLVVTLVFSILAIVVTSSVIQSLRGSRKSEGLGQVRENVDYAMNVMERLIRSSRSVTCTSPQQLDFVDVAGTNSSFVCDTATNSIASGSASLRLTSSDVNINCFITVFSCPLPATPDTPQSVIINIEATDADSQGAEAAKVTSTTKILLRSY